MLRVALLPLGVPSKWGQVVVTVRQEGAHETRNRIGRAEKGVKARVVLSFNRGRSLFYGVDASLLPTLWLVHLGPNFNTGAAAWGRWAYTAFTVAVESAGCHCERFTISLQSER